MNRASPLPTQRAAEKLIGLESAKPVEHPILFSAPMVNAILAGTKTVTRRVVPAPKSATVHGRHPLWSEAFVDAGPSPAGNRGPYLQLPITGGDMAGDEMVERVYPRWRGGDVLWVRENYWQVRNYPMMLPSGEVESGNCWGRSVHYSADGRPANTPNRHYPDGLRGARIAAPDPYADWAQRPSIHMAREHSRLTLEVTGVRVERLQAITEEQAFAEGVLELDGSLDEVALCARAKAMGIPPTESRVWFAELWDSINGKKSGCAWVDNPFVWCIAFRMVKP